MFKLHEVTKSYPSGESEVEVLRGISLVLAAGETYALVGPSGSGKSTLLALLAGLDRVTGGSLMYQDLNLGTATEDALAEFRAQTIGFVFQTYQLIPSLTALENVSLPAELADRPNAEKRAATLLERVGLAHRHHHYPAQLSGGEQQRVALARAYINAPPVLLGDEPTGSLDAESARAVEELLFELNREAGSMLVLATHNPELAARTAHRIELRGGVVVPKDAR